VRLAEILREDARIIEVGSGDFSLGASLVERGFGRFLGVATSEAALETARSRHPGLSADLVAWSGAGTLAGNDAEILILSDPTLPTLRPLRRHRHARWIVWAPSGGGRAWLATLRFARAVLFGELRGRLRLVGGSGWRDAGGRVRPALVARNLARKESSARHFIPPSLGIAGFLRALEEKGIRYVVLRWFEDLPELPPGEDLDLLVADDDVEQVRALASSRPGLVPCDLYSVSGRPGTAYRNMAYFPPALAEGILERAVRHRGRYRIPSPRDHFLSLSYHALYHKGAASGLPSRLLESQDAPEHDYAAVLGELARALGIDVSLTLEDLDEYLATEGWRPPLDTLGRLARRNAWVGRRIAGLAAGDTQEYRGLVVFLVRRRAVELGFADEIAERLAARGFEIVLRRTLSPDAAERVRRHARGANWERGPYPRSGGPPALALVAFDPSPLPPTRAQEAEHPGLENARILAKTAIRDALNARLPEDEHCNWLHSSDHAWGAREYLHLAVPEAVDEILQAARTARADGAAP
jgi:hypothetical protein